MSFESGTRLSGEEGGGSAAGIAGLNVSVATSFRETAALFAAMGGGTVTPPRASEGSKPALCKVEGAPAVAPCNEASDESPFHRQRPPPPTVGSRTVLLIRRFS